MLRVSNDIKLDFDDVLLIPKRSTLVSRADVKLTREYKFKHSSVGYDGIPIIAANMQGTGTFSMFEKLKNHGMSVALHKHYGIDELVDYFLKYSRTRQETKTIYVPYKADLFYTVGMNKTDKDKLLSVLDAIFHKTFMDPVLRMLCIDVANGYSEKFNDVVKEYRELFPDAVIMAGNVVTGNMVEELLISGADIIKVGIGSGSCCTTRIVTGVGYPQLSCISECVDAAHGLGGHICSDGGCTTPGDVAKAFSAGADFVMIGSMLSGTDECEGDWIYDGNSDKKKYLKFYGMSSKEAQEKWNGGLSKYRAAEGKEVKVPYRGSVDDIIQQILGGISSACTYTGARRLKDLPKCASFIKVNRTHNTVFGQ